MGERVDMDVLPKDAELRKRIAELDENELITIIAERAAGDYELEVFAVHAGEDRPVAGRMRAPHTGPDKKGHGFGLGMGSPGTKRLMALLPMPFDLRDEAAPAKPEAYVADGPDRCLRAMPAMRLMGGLPGGRGETAHRQLTPATHGLLPMGQPLMRRDEMYIAQRNVELMAVPSLSAWPSLRESASIRI